MTPLNRVDLQCADSIALFQRMFDETWKARSTRDRTGALPSGLRVRKVQRVEAPALWNRFSRQKRQMAMQHRTKPCTPVENCRGLECAGKVRTQHIVEAGPGTLGPCDSSVNEHYLFHGTSPQGALGIIREGFQLSRAGESTGMLFGPGAYFAEASSKFDEYADADEFSGMRAVLVCRVLCGEMFRTLNKLNPDVLVDPTFVDSYDSVLGDREASVGTYREFVVFKQEQIYPEFLVLYDREYE